MHTKKEIEQKLIEAEAAAPGATVSEQLSLGTVIIALRWVLEKKITTSPTDPVTGICEEGS